MSRAMMTKAGRDAREFNLLIEGSTGRGETCVFICFGTILFFIILLEWII